MRKKTVHINEQTRRLLLRTRLVMGYAIGHKLEILTVLFGDRIECDIVILNRSGGPVIYAVLRHNGHAVGWSQPSKFLPDRFSFSHDGDRFAVVIVETARQTQPRTRRIGKTATPYRICHDGQG